MKKTSVILSVLVFVLFLVTSCTNNTNKQSNNTQEDTTKSEISKVDTLQMSTDTLNSRIYKEIAEEIARRRLKLTKEALTSIAETESIIQTIEKGNLDEAKQQATSLIGKLEVILAQDSSLNLIPVDVTYQKHELITDINQVKSLVKDAKDAFNNGYYQLAGDLLNQLKSEFVINTAYLPLATYPEGLKSAVVLLDNKDTTSALALLQQILSSVVIEQTIIPIPILKAEQMVIEASDVYTKNKDKTDKILNLLDNAKYQLQLAEAMGYGKKDKDYATLYNSIKELEKSVKENTSSTNKFDELKKKIMVFKNRLFPVKNDKLK